MQQNDIWKEIGNYIQYLPKISRKKAEEYYKDFDIELLKELVEDSIEKVEKSLKTLGNSSKYKYIDTDALELLKVKVETCYNEFMKEFDYLMEIGEKKYLYDM